MRAMRKIERLGGLRTERNALANFYNLNTGGIPNYSSKSYTEVVNPALSHMGREVSFGRGDIAAQSQCFMNQKISSLR